ncbi:MAG: dihydropteroate synthase [Anaerolineae bacterium]|nr:dihydropteroate synthase [Anaerolineae bacterium]MCB9133692.1 dihydropteroate synthase [Anaerolineales bacterium]MCB9141104.1 dihydropteroate synthase [Anaerolineales bacterium]MCO5242523.1 dihydropteroate synthase [Anaerolineae bacterium]
MKIIGEKINGTRKRVAQAIAERDAEYIRDLAIKQTEAGSTWLDVNAGTRPDHEPDDLVWLIENIQAVVETPLALDSANPKALNVAIQAVNKTPMINSISGEPDRLEQILPIVAKHGCEVIALAMDDKKIPETFDKRMEVIDMVLQHTRAAGIPDGKVYVDPLALTIATMNQSAMIACDTIRAVHGKYPDLHFTMGLSNISFGLPARKQVNRGFLILAMQAGLDCAILDPLDKELRAAIVTTELLLGQDKYCKGYLKASRAGLFD